MIYQITYKITIYIIIAQIKFFKTLKTAPFPAKVKNELKKKFRKSYLINLNFVLIWENHF